MNKRSIVAGIIIAAALAAPFAASALSVDELQQQIRDLLAKVASLQVQLRAQTTASSTVTAVPVASPPARICALINRNLSRGQSGEDVRSLQEFLSTEGYLNTSATGFFGPATAQAVANWQMKNDISALGSFGPMSRARIKVWCGNNSNPSLLQVWPQKGNAPLVVTVISKTGDASDYRPSMADGRDTMIDFGDGSERQWVHCATTGQDIYPTRCQNPATFNHTYTSDGTYVVSLLKSGGMCMGGCKDEILASEKVVVGNTPIACTKEYKPVCGAKQVVCITTPCNPVPTTYGNLCMMKADGATFMYEGACRDTTTNPESDPMCKAWNDGCNTCGRSTPGGPAYCTLRACTPESMQKPYCSAYFDDASGNKPPVISSFSGPVALAVNEIGTWKITASDPENGSLKYSIMWGDEWTASDAAARMMAPQASIQQDSSFTHSYAAPGNYTVVLTVTDSQGKEARSTATVQVSQTACTAVYQPVCGRPNGCMNTCPVGMYCTMQCQLHQPQTYSSRCQMNNSNATFMHEGVCTGNEGYLQ